MSNHQRQSRADIEAALKSQGFTKKETANILSEFREQRWLKPSEVTEPGVYWVADTRMPRPGGTRRRLSMPLYAMNIVARPEGLREWNTMFCRPLSQWDNNVLLLGPIQPPEYKGE